MSAARPELSGKNEVLPGGHLLLRFLREEITPAEQAELDEWLDEAPVTAHSWKSSRTRTNGKIRTGPRFLPTIPAEGPTQAVHLAFSRDK
jgi:hypothetical protein